MPKLTQKKPLDEGLTIGVSKASRTTKAPHWYAYIYFPALSEQDKPTSLYKSLKLKYIEGSEANKREAIDRAYRLFNPIRKRYLEGNNNFLQKITIGYVIADFCKEAKDFTDANEALMANGNEPTNEVRGGKTYWTKPFYDALMWKMPELQKFFDTLPTQEIKDITFADLNRFGNWCAYNHPTWSPSSRNHHITAITHIWRHALNKGWVDSIHRIDRARPNLEKRRARHLTIEEFERMDDWLQKRCNSSNLNDYYRDLAFQFWCWVRIHSWCGVRPAAGTVEKNLIKWSHIEYGENGERLLLRENEKGHKPYRAVIHPYSYEIWDELKKFHQKRGTYKPDGYVFVHTHDGAARFTWYCDLETREEKAVAGEAGGAYRRFVKGDYIQSFRTQWRTMLEACGLDASKGAPRSERITPYALRHFFIQCRMNENPELRLVDLARSVGSSEPMLTSTYYRPDAEKNWHRMTTDARMKQRVPQYHPTTGLYVGSVAVEETDQ
jgi:integrase